MPRRLTLDEVCERSKIIHNNKYDYSLVEYINNGTNIIIGCPIHGKFTQSPRMHLFGQGCPLCGGRLTSTIEMFIQKAQKVHGDTYDYSDTVYVQTHDSVYIICKIHGSFSQTPLNHLQGSGCPRCTRGRDPNTTDWFIEQANAIHCNTYDYSSTTYVSTHRKVEIVCSVHGIFEQTPNVHLKGCGCPRCGTSVSNKETEWLNSIGVPDTSQTRQVRLWIADDLYKVDGLDSLTNTVYEFYGDFWHGHPTRYNPTDVNQVNHKTFGELYENTLYRRQQLIGAGYTLVEIWESDWDNIKVVHHAI